MEKKTGLPPLKSTTGVYMASLFLPALVCMPNHWIGLLGQWFGLTDYIGAWCFGYNNGMIGGCIVLPSFHRDFNLPGLGTSQYNNIISNLVSFTQIGGMFGSLLVYPIVKSYGRKPALAIGGFAYTAGAAMQVCS